MFSGTAWCIWWCSNANGTVARWVKVFQEGRDAIQNNLCTKGEQHSLTPCFPVGCWKSMRTVRELAAEVWVCHKTMLHILSYCKPETSWIPHEISEVQQGYHYADVQALLDQYRREGDDFLGQIVAMDETWLAHMNQTWNANQMNGSILVLLVQRKCTLHKVLWRWFTLVYDSDGVIHPRQMINTAYYCTFLQHHLCPALRRKRRHLVVQNAIIIHDNTRNHTAAAVTSCATGNGRF